MPPKKKKGAQGPTAEAEPAAKRTRERTTNVVKDTVGPSTEGAPPPMQPALPAEPRTRELRLARALPPTSMDNSAHKPRTGTLPVSVAGFAARAAASHAALVAALADADAAALLAAPGDVSWEEATLDALMRQECEATEQTEQEHEEGQGRGRGRGREEEQEPSRRQPRRLEPPQEQERRRVDADVAIVVTNPDLTGVDGDGGGEDASAPRASSVAMRTPAPLPAALLEMNGLVSSDMFSASFMASLVNQDRLARAEAAAPLRCVGEKKLAVPEYQGGLRRRKRFKTAEDIFRVVVEAKGESLEAKGESLAAAARGGVSDAAAIEEEMEGEKVVPGKDVLVSVSVHNPANSSMVTEEFLCLGTTALAEIKDAVRCVSDVQAKELGLPPTRNGFLFIEGTFYNDMRGIPSHVKVPGPVAGNGVSSSRGSDWREICIGTGGGDRVSEGHGGRGRGCRRGIGGRGRGRGRGGPAATEIAAPDATGLAPTTGLTCQTVPAKTQAIHTVDYSAPIIEFQRKCVKEGRQWAMYPVGARDFVLEAAEKARTDREAKALAEGVSAGEAKAAGDEAAKTAAAMARQQPPPDFVAKDMDGITLDQLSVVCGKPYLYCHQGNCEHIITFRDIRLAHPDDPTDRAVYPIPVLNPRKHRRKCSMCDVFDVQHVTYGDKLAPCSPCFFCDECFDALHLDSEGNPLYSEYVRYAYHHE